MLSRLTLCLVIGILAIGCKKGDNDPPAITKENLAGTYTLVSLKASSNGTEVDVTDQEVEPCEKDDQFKLNADNTYAYIDAGVKCDPPGGHQGTWSLQGKVLSFDDFEMTIDKFDGSILVGSETVTTDFGITYTLKATFKKL